MRSRKDLCTYPIDTVKDILRVQSRQIHQSGLRQIYRIATINMLHQSIRKSTILGGVRRSQGCFRQYALTSFGFRQRLIACSRHCILTRPVVFRYRRLNLGMVSNPERDEAKLCCYSRSFPGPMDWLTKHGGMAGTTIRKKEDPLRTWISSMMWSYSPRCCQ